MTIHARSSHLRPYMIVILAMIHFSLGWLRAEESKTNDAHVPLPSPCARHDRKVKQVREGVYDLVMIGDSITEFVGDSGGKDAPLNRVWQDFYSHRKAINLGYSGYRTENILWNLQNGELDFPQSPKVFTLLIGTNNTDDFHYKTTHSGEQVFAGIKAIIELIQKRHPSSKIILQAILPCGGPNEVADSPQQFRRSQAGLDAIRIANEKMKALADDQTIFWSDQRDLFLDADGKIRRDLMPDLIHPNETGARARANRLEPLLKKLLLEESKEK